MNAHVSVGGGRLEGGLTLVEAPTVTARRLLDTAFERQIPDVDGAVHEQGFVDI